MIKSFIRNKDKDKEFCIMSKLESWLEQKFYGDELKHSQRFSLRMLETMLTETIYFSLIKFSRKLLFFHAQQFSRDFPFSSSSSTSP